MVTTIAVTQAVASLREAHERFNLSRASEQDFFTEWHEPLAPLTTAEVTELEHLKGTGSLRGDTELKALLYKVFTGLASKTRKYRLCKGLRCFITR